MSPETSRTHHDRKDDRNSHEQSAEESVDRQTDDQRKRGGGHRSGSSGSGTLQDETSRAPAKDHALGSAAPDRGA